MSGLTPQPPSVPSALGCTSAELSRLPVMAIFLGPSLPFSHLPPLSYRPALPASLASGRLAAYVTSVCGPISIGQTKQGHSKVLLVLFVQLFCPTGARQNTTKTHEKWTACLRLQSHAGLPGSNPGQMKSPGFP